MKSNKIMFDYENWFSPQLQLYRCGKDNANLVALTWNKNGDLLVANYEESWKGKPDIIEIPLEVRYCKANLVFGHYGGEKGLELFISRIVDILNEKRMMTPKSESGFNMLVFRTSSSFEHGEVTDNRCDVRVSIYDVERNDVVVSSIISAINMCTENRYNTFYYERRDDRYYSSRNNMFLYAIDHDDEVLSAITRIGITNGSMNGMVNTTFGMISSMMTNTENIGDSLFTPKWKRYELKRFMGKRDLDI